LRAPVHFGPKTCDPATGHNRKALQDAQKAVGDEPDDIKNNDDENNEIENDGSESTLEQRAVSSFIFTHLFYANIKVRVHRENLQSSRQSRKHIRSWSNSYMSR
jgi:hypothetical protein